MLYHWHFYLITTFVISLENTKMYNISLRLCLESDKRMYLLITVMSDVSQLLVRKLLCCAVISQNNDTSFPAGFPALVSISRFDPLVLKWWVLQSFFLSSPLNSKLEILSTSRALFWRREIFVYFIIQCNGGKECVSKPLCFQCLIFHRNYFVVQIRKYPGNTECLKSV
jgi:hypothetical protein